MPTKEIVEVIQALKAEFDDLPDLGLGYPRKIAGSNTWSQHAYENAWDIGLVGVEAQEPVVKWLQNQAREGLPVGTILWAKIRADHYSHIHVEGNPRRSGIPPHISDPNFVTTWNAKDIKAKESKMPELRNDELKAIQYLEEKRIFTIYTTDRNKPTAHKLDDPMPIRTLAIILARAVKATESNSVTPSKSTVLNWVAAKLKS